MGVAARFKQLKECSGMLSVHCICHRLALACGDTGDDLKFISDFKTTMIQLWTSQTSQNIFKNGNEVKRIWRSPSGTTEISCAEGKKSCLDAGVEVVYMFLHALRSIAAEVLKKVDDMKFLAVL